ncbi:hypothetical protein Tsp_11350 [Trichinella spiralis]|uniref:hypothetical protein n=1 Tax=Trichinella spiralis TaxID=6334 RepID=UPI0001EFE551|nr:hypothetical protein Tsp_11350 [Trichinella spiralis]
MDFKVEKMPIRGSCIWNSAKGGEVDRLKRIGEKSIFFEQFFRGQFVGTSFWRQMHHCQRLKYAKCCKILKTNHGFTVRSDCGALATGLSRRISTNVLPHSIKSGVLLCDISEFQSVWLHISYAATPTKSNALKQSIIGHRWMRRLLVFTSRRWFTASAPDFVSIIVMHRRQKQYGGVS